MTHHVEQQMIAPTAGSLDRLAPKRSGRATQGAGSARVTLAFRRLWDPEMSLNGCPPLTGFMVQADHDRSSRRCTKDGWWSLLITSFRECH